jgi:hypothetical protein
MKGKNMKKQVLILSGVHQEIPDMQPGDELEYTHVRNVEAALEKLQQGPIDLLLISDEIAAADENKIRRLGPLFDEDIRVFKTAGLPLSAQAIHQVLRNGRNRQRSSYVIVDDALKHAAFNILIQ